MLKCVWKLIGYVIKSSLLRLMIISQSKDLYSVIIASNLLPLKMWGTEVPVVGTTFVTQITILNWTKFLFMASFIFVQLSGACFGFIQCSTSVVVVLYLYVISYGCRAQEAGIQTSTLSYFNHFLGWQSKQPVCIMILPDIIDYLWPLIITVITLLCVRNSYWINELLWSII